MIDIKRKEDCVGCSACVERCPVQCISFESDEQGFRYPKVNKSECIGCSLCERVCPVINKSEERKPLEVIGAINQDKDVVMRSSSGGIFHALASKIIEQGGVVFGARFDAEYNVIHSFTETIDGLKAFQGSKYMQSDMRESYKQAEAFLKQGRKVLFSGTPCQIAGLGLFLRKDYGDLLLKVDVVCHGVPSPLVWANYLREQIGNPRAITKLSFRDKRNSWNNYGFSFSYHDNGDEKNHFELMRDNIYMQAFLRDLTLRPSCFDCPAKAGRSHSDLTLGDFWKVSRLEPEIASDCGTSIVLINSSIGQSVIDALNLKWITSTYEKALISNPSIYHSASKPKLYEAFWRKYTESPRISIIEKYIRKSRGSFLRRVFRFTNRKLSKVLS